MRSAAAVSRSVKWCCVCGLKIPADIINPNHPLFGTVDHLIPRAAGGMNVLENRVPAHRMCNQAKGNRLSLSPGEVNALQVAVSAALRRVGVPTRLQGHAEARRRIVVPVRAYRKKLHIQRWEDDGGLAYDPDLMAPGWERKVEKEALNA